MGRFPCAVGPAERAKRSSPYQSTACMAHVPETLCVVFTWRDAKMLEQHAKKKGLSCRKRGSKRKMASRRLNSTLRTVQGQKESQHSLLRPFPLTGLC